MRGKEREGQGGESNLIRDWCLAADAHSANALEPRDAISRQIFRTRPLTAAFPVPQQLFQQRIESEIHIAWDLEFLRFAGI